MHTHIFFISVSISVFTNIHRIILIPLTLIQNHQLPSSLLFFIFVIYFYNSKKTGSYLHYIHLLFQCWSVNETVLKFLAHNLLGNKVRNKSKVFVYNSFHITLHYQVKNTVFQSYLSHLLPSPFPRCNYVTQL